MNARLVGGTRSSARIAPSTSPRPGPDPREAEGRGRDVAGVGAGTGDVEGLGHVGLAAGLAGEREGELGRELSRHLAVDRVERALRIGGPSPGERDQPGHPGSPPLPRVVDEQLLCRAVGLVVLAGLQGGARPGEQHLGADLGRALQCGQSLRPGRRCSPSAATAPADRSRRRGGRAGPASRARRRRPSATRTAARTWSAPRRPRVGAPPPRGARRAAARGARRPRRTGRQGRGRRP